MAMLKPYENNPHFYLWRYVPSVVASGIFVALYLGATAWIIYRMIRTKTKYPIPMAVAGIMEVVGYLARAWAEKNTDKLVPYSIQVVLILIAPALMAASIYMTLSRLMRGVDAEHLSFIPIRWLTKIFVAGDVLSFLIQAGGSSLSANVDVDPDIPKNIVIVGLAIQIIFFGVFIVTSCHFHLRLRRHPTGTSSRPQSKWRAIMHTLYVTSALILLRSVFRMVEYIMGIDSYLFSHEWPLLVFDSVPMFITMVVFGIWFPGDLTTATGAGSSQKPIPMYAYDSGESRV